MDVKQWVLTVAAVLAVLTTTPALASSLCGNRFDLGRGRRLIILGLRADQEGRISGGYLHGFARSIV